VTTRTEFQKSPIENATEDVIRDLNDAIRHEFQSHKLSLPEREFRKIVAGYLERQTLGEMRSLLGVSE
jgi:hypothetical protein